MSILIDDIQEELRREDLMQKFKKGLPWIILAVAGILISAAGYTAWQSMQEKKLVRYEAMYEEAVKKLHLANWGHIHDSDHTWDHTNAENTGAKDAQEAQKILEKVAHECPGLKFAALMAVSSAHKNQVMAHTKNHSGVRLNANRAVRAQLSGDDAAVLASFQDGHFRQFLALSRLLLDADSGIQYYGPSPFAVDHSVDHSVENRVSAENNAQKPPTHSDLKPLTEKERLNIFALYDSASEWMPLSMALAPLKMRAGKEKQQALKKWSKVYQQVLGPDGTIPMHTLMGTVEDFHS